VSCHPIFAHFCTVAAGSYLLLFLKNLLFCCRSKDLNMKTGDKIGKGLNKIKHGVLGKSMEGIIDPADPAFDIADMCDEESLMDQTLTMTSGKSLGSILEYRDLSAWRISISRVAPHCDALGKKFFVFVIDVQRIDITSTQENAEDLHWTVLRRYSEFYTLESKLTEFHGPFEDLHLPAKANFFIGKGLDVLQTKIKPFEEYLTGLLKKPFLRESDILFTFLTSPEEFTLASSTFGVGKMINKVPIKLTKERGQSLQPFIDNFVQSTQSPPSKPR
jgi:sorting nexin-14